MVLLFLFGFFTGYTILIVAREAWKWKSLTNKKKRKAKDNGLLGNFDVDRAKLEDTANEAQFKSSPSKRLRKCLKNDCMSCELIYSDKYTFKAYKERTPNFLLKLNLLRKEKQFCDVKLITEDSKEIWAHKNVLSSNCEYFERMFSGTFKESNLYEVIIKHIPNDVLDDIISFIYTSQLVITEQNVENLLVASNFMLLDDVCQSCEENLKNLTTPENCMHIMKIADDYNLNDLQKFCMSYAMDHFEFLATTSSFLNSPHHQIEYLIANDNLCAKEETVCSAVINWVKFVEETRLKDLPNLLRYVRFSLLSSEYLKNIIKSEPIIYSNPNFVSYFYETWHHQIIEGKSSIFDDTLQRKPLIKSIVVLCSSNNLTDITSFHIKWFDPIIHQWLSYPSNLTVPWNESTLVMVNGSRLFAVGGQENEDNRGLKSFGEFNVQTNSWDELPEMKCRRIRPGVVLFKNCIYVFGGQKKIYDESVLCNGEYFDLDTKKWYSVRRMHTKRSDFNLFVINGLIYPEV
ncbi:ring canal kelch homolog isoform X3 [Adelges cooleyi]|uniref:ring canal kelch homolog isoform X3 n=1 Tax=Adelges cooleyi TaxID=133065 RepID=UPI00217FCF23|nr:ring canal kelch homolog isoform X3 [Adelges cooleyi]